MNKISEFIKLYDSKEPKTLLQHLLDYEYNPSFYLDLLEDIYYYSNLGYGKEVEVYREILFMMEERWTPFESSSYSHEIQIIKDYLGRECQYE